MCSKMVINCVGAKTQELDISQQYILTNLFMWDVHVPMDPPT